MRLEELLPREMMAKNLRLYVIQRLQASGLGTDERQRLYKEWAGRTGSPVEDWVLRAVTLSPKPAEE